MIIYWCPMIIIYNNQYIGFSFSRLIFQSVPGKKPTSQTSRFENNSHRCSPLHKRSCLFGVILSLHAYIPTYIHTYIPTYIHTYLPTYIPTYIHTYLPTYIHTYICIYIYTYIHIVHTYVCIYICIFIYIYT